jgi:hypothetical protein
VAAKISGLCLSGVGGVEQFCTSNASINIVESQPQLRDSDSHDPVVEWTITADAAYCSLSDFPGFPDATVNQTQIQLLFPEKPGQLFGKHPEVVIKSLDPFDHARRSQSLNFSCSLSDLKRIDERRWQDLEFR